MSKRVTVIGGGAAGLMASIAAAESGAEVTLLEPNERLGKKVNITGKGRCNVTNDCSVEEMLRNVPGNGRFLYSALSRFDSRDAMAFFESLGVALKVERGNRVFPVSDRAFDVTAALERRIRALGVRWVRDRATEICTADGHVTAVRCRQAVYPADAAVLATGGVSYPATGSTGDGYRMAAALGHTTVPLRGSLVPLECDGDECLRMQGLTLKNVAVAVRDEGGKTVFRDFGELLFTHFGVSGPVILSASAHLRQWEGKTYTLEIDLKPALDAAALDARILRDIAAGPNKEFAGLLGGLVPRSMVPVLCRRLGAEGARKLHSLKKEERLALVKALKCFCLTLRRPRPADEAIVTAGGIKVEQVRPSSMESKLVQGLYFAGEILDVDAYTGGFNLQIAWATGRLAGRSAAQEQGESA